MGASSDFEMIGRGRDNSCLISKEIFLSSLLFGSSFGGPGDVLGMSLGCPWEVFGRSLGGPWEVLGRSLGGPREVLGRVLGRGDPQEILGSSFLRSLGAP